MDSVLTLGLDSVLLPPKTAFSLPILNCVLLGQRPSSPARISVLSPDETASFSFKNQRPSFSCSAQPQEGFLLLRYASETAAALLLELKDGTQKNLTRAGTRSPPKLRVEPENLTRAGTRSPPRLRVRSPTGDTRALNSAADRLNNRRAEADKSPAINKNIKSWMIK